MIEQMKFIEALKEIKSLLGAGANIGAMNKIDKTITEYQLEVEEFDKWAEAESQKDEYLRGTVVSDSLLKSLLAHPREFFPAKSE